jgi:hypothetical protein
MPHLAFFAAPSDVVTVLAFVFAECQVFESYSMPGMPLRRFAALAEAIASFDECGPAGLVLMLYSPAMRGDFAIERFELKPGVVPGATWREKISGWGLIQMELPGLQAGKLRQASTNHNSEKRARLWAKTYPNLPPVEAWDFQEVTRVSRRINRHIGGLAVRKEGSRPVLPAADAMAARGNIILSVDGHP